MKGNVEIVRKKGIEPHSYICSSLESARTFANTLEPLRDHVMFASLSRSSVMSVYKEKKLANSIEKKKYAM